MSTTTWRDLVAPTIAGRRIPPRCVELTVGFPDGWCTCILRHRLVEEAVVRAPVTVSTVPPYTVVAASGELDLAIAPELRRRLHAVIEDGITDVIVDLSEATFVDSTILGVLV